MATIVRAENVSMKFNLSKNKETRLKEYAINLLKGKLKFEEFWALRDISFEVEKGDSLGFIGVNGSGKSTLLRIVAGIVPPSKGTVEINGSIAPLIAMGAGFDPTLSARENIYLVGAMHGHSRKFMEERFFKIMDFAELWKFIDTPIQAYSSGMKSRLGFALATLVDADILIADEALSAGDMTFRKKCEKRMEEMMGDGTTVLFVSHNMAQVKRVCKRAIWLEKGKIKMAGSSKEVCNEYEKWAKLKQQGK